MKVTLRLLSVTLGVVLHGLNPGLAEAATDCIPLVITSQPESLAVLESCPVTLTVGVKGTAPFACQWFRDQQPVAGATNLDYTIPHISLADNGAVFYASVSNACSQAASSEAELIVVLDVVPPRLLRARGDASLERVLVTFGVGGCSGGLGLDIRSAQDPLNYSLSGGVVVSYAQLQPDGTNVLLTTTRQTPGALYTLTVDRIADWNGNRTLPGSETTWQSWVMLPGSDPPKFVPPPVSLTRAGTDLWVTWPYGSFLQWASDVRGPWYTLEAPDFPYPIPTDGYAHFYRALFDP